MFHIDQKIVRFVTFPIYNTAAPRIVHPKFFNVRRKRKHVNFETLRSTSKTYVLR